MVEIETRRLLLRRWQSKDLDAYSRLCADPEVMRYIGSGPRTREQSEEQISRFVRHWDERGFGLWAVEYTASGEFVVSVRLVYQD
jgi:RimJ/RimL family protein N-acetyltransferase